jgi:hypothetical protein
MEDGSPYKHARSQTNTEWIDIFQKTELYRGGSSYMQLNTIGKSAVRSTTDFVQCVSSYPRNITD